MKKYFLRITTIFLAIMVAATFAAAQDEEPIKVETNLVSIGVVVKDKKGNFVKDLKQEQFELFDNNAKAKIEFFSKEDAPISYGFVYDLHPTTSDRTKTILGSIKAFTSELREKDDFFTVVFNERGSLNLDFVPSVEQVEKHLSGDGNKKPNSLYDLIYQAGEKIRLRQNAKKTLIIISDGKDHNSHHTYETLRNQLRSFNVQIYSILLDEKEQWGFSDITLEQKRRAVELDNSTLDKAAIEELSKVSGGTAKTPFLKTGQELSRIFQQIQTDMTQQYSLGFYPTITDNGWHKLKVNLKNGSYKLTYRKGYQNVVTK
jgi:Ca-activated chloride channel family protein